VFRDKLHAWVAYLFGSKPQKPTHTQAAPPVHHAAPKHVPAPVPAAPPAASTPPAAASMPQTFAPRELPPLLGGPGAAASMPASTATVPRIAPTIVAPGAAQDNGVFPPEVPGSTPTPTPDVPEATSGANADGS
jgi:penicillin-binding protein 1A